MNPNKKQYKIKIRKKDMEKRINKKIRKQIKAGQNINKNLRIPKIRNLKKEDHKLKLNMYIILNLIRNQTARKQFMIRKKAVETNKKHTNTGQSIIH